MAFVLGIDGGASKTVAAVAGGSSVSTQYVARGCNFTSVSREDAQAALVEAVRGGLASAGIVAQDVAAVCAGVAGAAFRTE